MRTTIRFAGLDGSKDTITIASAPSAGDPEVVGAVANGWMVLERRLRRLVSLPAED
jgi:hypothetical protein